MAIQRIPRNQLPVEIMCLSPEECLCAVLFARDRAPSAQRRGDRQRCDYLLQRLIMLEYRMAYIESAEAYEPRILRAVEGPVAAQARRGCAPLAFALVVAIVCVCVGIVWAL